MQDPDVICNALPFCRKDEVALIEHHEVLKVEASEGPFCTLCEESLGQILSLVTDRRLQSDIEDLIKSLICEALPTPLNGAISAEEGPMCAMCDGFLNDVAALATNAEFKDDIEKTLEGITCEFLSTPFSGISSGNICKILGLCGPEIKFWQKVSAGVSAIKETQAVHHVVRHVTAQNWAPVLGHFQAVLWKPVTPKSVSEDVGESPQCILCKEVLGELETIFTNPALKKDVENLSEVILCTALPGELKKMCETEVDRFTKLFFDFVGVSMNATNVCDMTGICWDDNLLHQSLVAPPMANKILEKDTASLKEETITSEVQERPQCTLCKEVIGQFDHLLINTALKEDIEFLTEAGMCSLLPTKLKARCKQQVEKFTDVIFDMINLSFNATNICEIIGVCWGPDAVQQTFSERLAPALHTINKVLTPVAPLVKKIKEENNKPVMEHVTSFILEKYPHIQAKDGSINDAACNVCRRVMDTFKTLMDDSKFKEDMEEMVDELFCPLLPKTFQGMCKMEINQIISTFFDILDTDLDVTIMCDFLGMCQDDNNSLHYTVQGMYSSFLASLTKMAEAALPALEKLQQIKTEQGDCALCEIMMGKMFSVLKNDNSRGKMVALGVKYCDLLTEPLSAHCKMFVGENTANFMDIVVHRLTPKMVCQSTAMCNAKQKRSADHATVQNPKDLLTILGAAAEEVKSNQPMPKKADTVLKITREHRAPWCDICEEVSSTVNAFIGSQELLRVAISVGDSVCMLMPTGLKYPCDTFVRTFFDEFLGDVSSFMTPDFVCGVSFKRFKSIPVLCFYRHAVP
ncbi:proactivator polypeptide [Elysia marginata]|uniref:Proactivator polypeptide n=1 Tax=Elysia marginata TaxID=1093978 RepID=A0AAV4JDF9_9GAST|nr:proactivator polypeptide [Elysia marginata]